MQKEREQVVQSWLQLRQTSVRPWIRRAVLFGCCQYLFIILQAASLAWTIDKLVMAGATFSEVLPGIAVLLLSALGRGVCGRQRELAGQQAGEQVRTEIRGELLARIDQMGPAILANRPAGSWLTLLMEQVDKLHDYYARYLPQMGLVRILPIITILLALSFSWLIALVLLITAPLLVLFMVLVGKKAAAASQRNVQALSRLSAHFLDRLQGLTTLRLFYQSAREKQAVASAAESFREKTMQVLRLAFLSSTVLEFFTAISIAITAVFLGMSYLGYLNFGLWGDSLSLFTGLFLLLIAPEYYQPLRELGTYYHAKADAIGAGDDIEAFLNSSESGLAGGQVACPDQVAASVVFRGVSVTASNGRRILDDISFELQAGQQLVVVGESGAGKTTLLNVLLGFTDYEGEVLINGVSLRELDLFGWRQQLAWLGQNPRLFHGSLRDNITLAMHDAADDEIARVMQVARVDEFLDRLPQGLDSLLGDEGSGLSVGQAQRVALARALLRPFQLLVMDEPTASLDHHSATIVNQAVNETVQGRSVITITHRPESLGQAAQVLMLEKGRMIAVGSQQELLESCPPFQRLVQQWQTLASVDETDHGGEVAYV
ncbi:heme ABC transporter permease/ATP-binding protein CydD [Parendozoicomonas haliclonae]|uniref:ATP-binding/permease protein CydD n=1 Tax=Parendozoicomonas haliclonae TaxID=1960125 RepID=A0A1X7APS0_9GAMM|nr:cysteine/glutathione ABC transporter permease/ATP-binding protein CydD [Parendozoicomonas haliclonae]SMA50089.1 ATP-binding/permease protein CydD [Parendozoicomonas haliclonae]